MGRIRNKKIWLYFDKVSDYAARCKNCKLHLSCKHTSANLVRHLYYKHQVDASFYGAERTGFLKQKRVYQRSSAGLGVTRTYPPIVALPESYEQIDVMKEEVIPMKLEPCNRSHEDYEDRLSLHEYQKSSRSLSSPPHHTNCTEETNEQRCVNEDMRSENITLHDVEHAISGQISVDTSQLEEKLKAETRYYNEMAELARAKRIMVELQSKKLMMEMETMRSS
ncbi:uncharacterized protein [Eurosta solidaginis]|uniref:uncharacterized protein n=1 Tax=Eurosta solidaginis TaxID=178769 RepID=UPI0035315220